MTGQKNTKSNKNRGEHKITQKRATKGNMRNNKRHNKSTQPYAYTDTNATKNQQVLTENKPLGFCFYGSGWHCSHCQLCFNGLSKLYFAGCSPHIRKVWHGHYFISSLQRIDVHENKSLLSPPLSDLMMVEGLGAFQA